MVSSSSVGMLAAFLTTAAFVPQVVRVMRTRDTHAISLWMYLMFSAGVALWCVYGLLLDLWPVVLANGVTLALALVVIAFKLRATGAAAPD
jgi:MtN3 and saliva related transmembrane protein